MYFLFKTKWNQSRRVKSRADKPDQTFECVCLKIISNSSRSFPAVKIPILSTLNTLKYKDEGHHYQLIETKWLSTNRTSLPIVTVTRIPTRQQINWTLFYKRQHTNSKIKLDRIHYCSLIFILTLTAVSRLKQVLWDNEFKLYVFYHPPLVIWGRLNRSYCIKIYSSSAWILNKLQHSDDK